MVPFSKEKSKHGMYVVCPKSKGSFTLPAEPNRTDSAWKTNLRC